LISGQGPVDDGFPMKFSNLIVFGIGIFVFSASVQAELSFSELSDLETTLKPLSVKKEPACVAPDPNKPLKLFIFEGAEGYCPRYAHMNLYPDADGITPGKLFSETEEVYENRPFIRRIRTLLRAEDDKNNCNLTRNLVQHHKRLSMDRIQKTQIYYYSKTGYDEAAKCVESWPREERIRAFAYSMGGYGLLKFAERLEKKKIQIESVMTIDPVGQNFLWISGVLFAVDNPIFKVTSNIGRWLNFHQKFDRSSLFEGPIVYFGARGSFVIGADVNREILPSDMTSQWQIEHAHIAIHTTEPVQQGLKEIY
jgi:hypothetical protein